MNAARIAVTAYITSKAVISFYQRAGIHAIDLTKEEDPAPWAGQQIGAIPLTARSQRRQPGIRSPTARKNE